MSNILQLEVDRYAAPNTKNGKVPPRRRKNSELRSREYLTPDEVEQLTIAAGKFGRHRHRDRTLILIAFRHALRVSEQVALRLGSGRPATGLLHVTRSKNGTPSSHPLRGPEIRALRQLKRILSDWRRGPVATAAERKIIARTGKAVGVGFPVPPICYATPAGSSWRMMDMTPV